MTIVHFFSIVLIVYIATVNITFLPMHHCITDKTKASHSFSWKLKSPSSAISQASLWCQKIIMTNSFLNSNNTSLAKTFFSSYFHLFFPVPIFSQIIYPGICAKSHFHPNNFSNKGNCVFWQPHLMRQMPWMQSFFVILSPSSPAYSYIEINSKESWQGYDFSGSPYFVMGRLYDL